MEIDYFDQPIEKFRYFVKEMDQKRQYHALRNLKFVAKPGRDFKPKFAIRHLVRNKTGRVNAIVVFKSDATSYYQGRVRQQPGFDLHWDYLKLCH